MSRSASSPLNAKKLTVNPTFYVQHGRSISSDECRVWEYTQKELGNSFGDLMLQISFELHCIHFHKTVHG